MPLQIVSTLSRNPLAQPMPIAAARPLAHRRTASARRRYLLKSNDSMGETR
ncbi:hypothetical protein BURPSPAST_AC0505 [Burkholderia pseudomallei Pasteur 52237]|nr:hypothetical protein BURPSPAST_AC0505 [Burkholderia pseudomallei Pasteur 52237]